MVCTIYTYIYNYIYNIYIILIILWSQQCVSAVASDINIYHSVHYNEYCMFFPGDSTIIPADKFYWTVFFSVVVSTQFEI